MTTALTPLGVAAQELPGGGTVAHGTVDIARPGAGSMTITQGTGTAVVNWDSFSIGKGGAVDIRQPGRDAALLNRVTGSTTSQIHGRLTANGQVFVVNPNGIFIGPTSHIEAGGFVASTLAIRNEDFILGQPVFEGGGASAAVTNQGRINIVPGGYAALLGGKVSNAGVIRVPMGKVGLGAGERATLDLGGDGFLQVAIPSDTDDADLEALIENSGTIEANGGQVEMIAATARRAVRNAINLGGVVEARSVSGRNGAITLGGGDGGSVKVTGHLRAQAPARIATATSLRPAARPATGGAVTITGHDIALQGATIDVTGDAGGGSVRIGGAYQGGAGLPRAQSVSVDAATTILGDATRTGDGGRIIVWSDDTTRFDGRISARGGADSGNGGFAEVSGKRHLYFAGSADLRATAGDWGRLMLDPTDFEVVAALSGAPNELLFSDVQNQLEIGNFEITTSSSDLDPGDITVSAGLTWTTASVLTLSADNGIALNAPISAAIGGLALSAFGAPITTSAAGSVDVADFTLQSGDWQQLGTPLPAFNAADFTIFSGASFLRALGGDGAGAPYRITDVYGLQGIGTGSYAADNFALANPIDASVTATWRPDFIGFTGFAPIVSFSGTLDGNRHAIDGLRSRQSSFGSGASSSAALIDVIAPTGVVQDLSLTDAIVEGPRAGIVAGRNEGTISGVSAQGLVISYEGDAGGLAAVNAGSISDSYAIAGLSVTIEPATEPSGGSSYSIGGLVGLNDLNGTITRSDSDGDVAFDQGLEVYAGGLVGQNIGTITDAFATTPVTATSATTVHIGGLVGGNAGTIDRTYSTGAVTLAAGCCSLADAGGLVGINVIPEITGTVSNSFWDTQTSGQATSDGGTPLLSGDFQTTQGFIDRAAPLGWDFDLVWAPGDSTFYPVNYSTASVIFARPDDTTFVYNGTATGFPVTGAFSGGVGDYRFGPLNDTLDRAVLNDDVLADGSDAGLRSFAYQTTSLQSTQGVNFRIVDLSALVDITPAPLTVTADDQTKRYGTTFGFADTEFTTAGLVVGDSVDSVSLTSEAAPAGATVTGSPYSIDAGAATGTGLGNYDITYVPGAFTVTPAPLSVLIDDRSKQYGDAVVFDGSEFTVTGLVNSDSLSSVTLTSIGAPGTAPVSGSPYAIDGGAPVGNGLENYTVSFAPGDLTVTPAPLSITAQDQSKQYGTAFVFEGTEFITMGLLNSDSVDSVSLASDAAPANATVAGSPYPIGASAATGTGLGNYTIAYAPGAFTVTPAPLSVLIDDRTKTYGDLVVFDGTEFTTTGLRNGDSVASLVLSSPGAGRAAGVSGSPYAIDGSGAVGSGLENYALTIAPGALSVTPASLRVIANDQSKAEGTVFRFAGTEFTTQGLLNADSVDAAVLSSDGAADSAPAADSPYAISIAQAEGTGLGNYDIAYVDGTFVVTNGEAAPPPPPERTPPPPFGTSLPNPKDALNITLTSNAAPQSGGSASLDKARETLAVVESLSGDTEIAIKSCGISDADIGNYLTCMAEALDTYANALDEIVNDLPSGMENVSAIIRTARSGVTAAGARAQARLATATTDAERRAIRVDALTEARASIDTARTEIRKAITLIRADDPELTRVQQQTVMRIVNVFDTVDTELVRAVEL
ncbi:filamentous hemagglutinin N-terminal domain-containing protein [Sulfitobacter sabulilitoris]|uniref:Filamentous hemagglutinin N-terminal domain-containing protein n=2 Tax=Sulfitobacter sabulilitoris TaxID=2562655 RepID=A0A5S3PPP6_9RHOB|nr:filamentous hemagglutinin N-terminal domain-containing protein [Sulfitobacter sabulilitoris]